MTQGRVGDRRQDPGRGPMRRRCYHLVCSLLSRAWMGPARLRRCIAWPTACAPWDVRCWKRSSRARARARNVAEPHCETRMDDQSIEFHRKVYDAYHALAEREPERVKVVNG